MYIKTHLQLYFWHKKRITGISLFNQIFTKVGKSNVDHKWYC